MTTKFRSGPRGTEFLHRAAVEEAAQPKRSLPRAPEVAQSDASALRSALETLKSEIGGGGLNSVVAETRLSAAVARRQQFWLETCGETPNHRPTWKSAEGLRRAYGWRLCKPTPEQVQFILDLLDAAFPTWDDERPARFFDKLEAHFSHLARYYASGRR